MTSPVRFQNLSFSYGADFPPVFTDLTLEIPAGVTSLTGQNGTGKSTLLLLASGRLVPTAGQVLLHGQDTAGLSQPQRDELAAVVYQNMEFETEDKLGDLLNYVWESGFLAPAGSPDLVRDLARVFELEGLLGRPTQALAKGEMQRAIMAFALLYGSRTVVMDEPVFALEDRQKQACLDYLCHHARSTGRSFLYSVHELDLTKKYSDHLLLFFKDRPPIVGPTDQLLRPEFLEEAYQVPWELLHKKESLVREALKKTAVSAKTAENGYIL